MFSADKVIKLKGKTDAEGHMNKGGLKNAIKRVILSDSGLKRDYDVLLKNKIGHMTNKVHEHCDSRGDKYLSNATKYFIGNSGENTRMIYSNIINSKVKDRLKNLFGGRINDAEFNTAMLEVIDDLAYELR